MMDLSGEGEAQLVREQDMIAAMERDHRDEDAKQRYEEFLAETRPEAVERQLLRLERQIARSYTDEAAMDRLIDDYIQFRTEHYYFFWDHRGAIGHLFRTFNLWLVSFSESRRFAVEQAFRLTRGIRADVNLDDIPVVVEANVRPDAARDTKEKIIDFVRRYKGPTGREPEVQAGEIVLIIAPSWIEPAPKK